MQRGSMGPPVSEGGGQFKAEGPPGGGARVVLLGASNLTRGFATVVSTARRFLGRPVEVLAALGHGRSYGNWSSVLARSLPGIIECGLWSALRQRPPAPTCALLTDAGNDILYHMPVIAIVDWIARCLDRLSDAGARTVLTLLPAAGIERLGPVRYYFLREVFFPRSRVSFSGAVGATIELNQRLRDLAAARSVAVVEPDPAWYGFDPIHVKLRHRGEAWATMLAAWRFGNGPVPAPSGPAPLERALNVLLLVPEYRRVFGIAQRRAQPCRTLPDGSTLSLY
jgi:hypothetical protein